MQDKLRDIIVTHYAKHGEGITLPGIFNCEGVGWTGEESRAISRALTSMVDRGLVETQYANGRFAKYVPTMQLAMDFVRSTGVANEKV